MITANIMVENHTWGYLLLILGAVKQAVEFGHSYEREVAFLTVHSVLHLLGYDHEISPEDEADMIARQKKIMNELNILR